MTNEETLKLIEQLTNHIKEVKYTARSEQARGDALSGAFYYGFASGLEFARALINSKI